ncbi:cache domain-containing sensor histidine kinase [Paenibacillus qinlingensis]|uniref:cache domain-containing sensor histidine kinase n=1 Tax=Paenibacillus qinlingensis TaxID=1837343 RepID=UPI001563FA97|nr:sensor histidine kinase [Paenibacillus qinlingensis]NQX62431.1 sensor histidine kinase [Paenibacillus qinlingensis]
MSNLLRSFQFKSIHTKFALAFSCLILCTTVILSYSAYRLSTVAVTDASLTYTNQLIEQVNKNIQTYIGNMESISTLSLSNTDLKQYLSLKNTQEAEAQQLKRQISSYFSTIVASRNDIASIVFIGSNGAVVSDRVSPEFKPYAELISQEWYSKANRSKGDIVISSSHVQHVYQNEYKWVVSISKQMPSPGPGGASGVLLVDLNFNLINDLCNQIQLGQRGYVFILDQSGDLIYHPQQQLLYSGLKSEDIRALMQSQDSTFETVATGENKIYTVRTTSFGWKMIGVTYAGDLSGNKKEMQLTSAMWGGIALIIALAISIWLSITLTKPIKQLEVHMKQVEKGNFDIRVDVEGANEISKLSRTFNLMISKIKELMSQTVLDQEVKRISELKALQAQIQPHFLYNTLDLIIWMAEMGKVDDVVTMTSALSKLLRSSISKGEELVPIRVELAHIENYLTIQNIRYRNKFTYDIEVEADLLEDLSLKIVLQPLVENAIYHGMKHLAESGHIRITGQKRDGVIELKVMDNGVGMSDEQLKALRLKTTQQSQSGKGFGVPNVNHRIQLYFGELYGLQFESELEEGTTVTITFPVMPPVPGQSEG